MASYNFYSCISLSLYVSLLFRFSLVESHIVPALYVFGDSFFDSGNNNFLQTQAKANYRPYGIDFPFGATGRFTNGNTVADFIAKWLGLPYVPAYLVLLDSERRKITTGINYASGAAGILPESGTVIGDNLSLDEQINYFQNTVTNDLPNSFKTQADLSRYLSKSIFLIAIGTNDYTNNYLQRPNYNSSQIYNPQQFAQLLLNKLQSQLTTLYNLGARKIVVFEIGPVGCKPAVVNRVNPKPTTPCFEPANELVKIYNFGLQSTIQNLSSSLPGSTFVRGAIYQQNYDTNQNPLKFGFTGGRTSCCVVGGVGTTMLCLRNKKPCFARNEYLYWDSFHPTQQAYVGTASGCFIGSLCVPINIQLLALNQ